MEGKVLARENHCQCWLCVQAGTHQGAPSQAQPVVYLGRAEMKLKNKMNVPIPSWQPLTMVCCHP